MGRSDAYIYYFPYDEELERNGGYRKRRKSSGRGSLGTLVFEFDWVLGFTSFLHSIFIERLVLIGLNLINSACLVQFQVIRFLMPWPALLRSERTAKPVPAKTIRRRRTCQWVSTWQSVMVRQQVMLRWIEWLNWFDCREFINSVVPLCFFFSLY